MRAIQPNELRIGSWVYSTLLERPFQIDLKTLSSYPRCEPIPLTEKWLEDFGFEKRGGAFYMDLKSHQLVYVIEDCVMGISNMVWLPPVVKYVHQLQNLYFALTQTELKQQ